MFRKAAITVGLTAILLLTLLPGLSAQDDFLTRVCMIPDLGTVDDGTYKQFAYEGMLAAASDYGLETTVFTSDSLDDFEPNIQKCIDEGYQIIVTVGPNLGEITLQFARENPDIYFIGIDQFGVDVPTNFAFIGFREDQAAFLVGYLAGLVTESNTVAGVYGIPFPALKRFRNGFEQGVRYAAEEEGKEMNILGVYLDSFTDPSLGAGAASVFIEQGADVIFGAAGQTGTGAILLAAQKDVYVIGVDQDEYFTSFGGGTVEGSDHIISSAIKRVDVGVYSLLSVLVEGRFDEFPGGGTYVLGVDLDGVTFANAHDAEVSAEIYDRVAEVQAMMAAGELTTGVDPETGDLLPE